MQVLVSHKTGLSGTNIQFKEVHVVESKTNIWRNSQK